MSMGGLKTFLTAWNFLTIVPVPIKSPFEVERMGASALYYPIVGLILGGLLLLLDHLLAGLLSRPMASLLLVLTLVLLTGGIHVDGLADTVDGLAGGRTPEERLEIMRDGRIGALGAVALFFLLALKFLALASLSEIVRPQALVAFPFVGRSMMIPAAYFSTYPRPEGLGKEFVGKIPTRAGAGAFLIFILGIFFLFQYKGLAMAMLSLAASIFYARWMTRTAGGITGDHLGALEEGAEALFLILLCFFYPAGFRP